MGKAKNSLTSRMKENYELRCRHWLPRRSYVLIRVDGRSFHTWTKGLNKPYDVEMMKCMDTVAFKLFEEIPGAKFGYVQSDEVSLLITDFDKIGTEAWFDNCQNKLESVSASIATMAFNREVIRYARANLEMDITKLGSKAPDATFDSRAWTIPDYVEVENYFIDRQKDAIRNSVTMLANYYASHKSLLKKKVSDRHEVIRAAGDDWEKHPLRFRRGAAVYRVGGISNGVAIDQDTPEFTKDRGYLKRHIPRHWADD